MTMRVTLDSTSVIDPGRTAGQELRGRTAWCSRADALPCGCLQWVERRNRADRRRRPYGSQPPHPLKKVLATGFSNSMLASAIGLSARMPIGGVSVAGLTSGPVSPPSSPYSPALQLEAAADEGQKRSAKS